MKTFIVGNTYTTRSICDHDCIISITVAKRTASTITTTEGKMLRTSEYDNAEIVYPMGQYSMAPKIKAI
jgi:hypothetical protein